MAFLLGPSILAAQMQRGGIGQQMKTQMHANMGMMADMMAKMYEMMNKGKATSEQWQEMTDIMEQMIQMMKEMSVPHGGQMQEQHQKQLQEMSKRLKALYENVVR
jgi:replicative DNA helicase